VLLVVELLLQVPLLSIEITFFSIDLEIVVCKCKFHVYMMIITCPYDQFQILKFAFVAVPLARIELFFHRCHNFCS
jgi:hypothetical protein